jgi:hypothetical protein
VFARILFSIRTHGAMIVWAPTNKIDREFDPKKFPWELKFDLQPPEFMNIAFIMAYGGSQNFVVRGKSREALMRLVRVLGIFKRTDLMEMKITDPNGKTETLESMSNRRRRALS